jgi:NAD(P)-dependent dehydrogenase (short-subunit alcohol dehydrogenase family)
VGRFSGRRAVVTGASRGIGAGIAERLAAEGADVAITARTLDAHDHLSGNLREVVDRLVPYGGTVLPIVADLTDDDDRAAIIPAAVEGLGGPIDILVNNAAAAMYIPPADYPLKRRRLTFEVNVHAPLDLAQAVIPSMRERGEGWILNLSSGSTRLPEGPPYESGALGTTLTIYAASKAALNRMTAGLAAELHGTGIRVNCVQPRAAVMSEGAEVLLGGRLGADQIETMEEMVEATIALCDCGPDITGRIAVSLDLIDEWGLKPRNLDGSER